MAFSHEPELPPELRETEARLRQARPSFSELELDQLKLRTLNRASSGLGRTRGTPMRSRIVALTVSALLLGGATGGAIAAGGGNDGSNAAKAEYKPGNGCGDENHTHTGPPGNPGKDKCPPQSGGDHGKGGGGDNGKGGGRDNGKGNGGKTTTTAASTTTTSSTTTSKDGNGKGKK